MLSSGNLHFDWQQRYRRRPCCRENFYVGRNTGPGLCLCGSSRIHGIEIIPYLRWRFFKRHEMTVLPLAGPVKYVRVMSSAWDEGMEI